MSNAEDNENTPQATPVDTEATNENVPAPRWAKGMASPNPKGRPKQPQTVREVRELAKQKTVQMIEVLSKVALNPKSPPAARAAAASSILDRAWGKPQGDFGEAEGLIIKVVKLSELPDEPPMKTIEHDPGEGE